MQLTRSSSDPMAFPAQPFWQQRRSFTPLKGNAMRRRPQADRTRRSWTDQIFGPDSCASDQFDSTGRARAAVLAGLNSPNVDSASENSRPMQRAGDWSERFRTASNGSGRASGTTLPDTCRAPTSPTRGEALRRIRAEGHYRREAEVARPCALQRMRHHSGSHS
jgi:hypothetical protein